MPRDPRILYGRAPEPRTPRTTPKRRRLGRIIAAAALTLTPAIAVTPIALAGTTFYAGSLFQHHNAAGTNYINITFTNYGACDSAGYSYTVPWNSTGQNASSFEASGANGCNMVRLYNAPIGGASGGVWVYSGCRGQVANFGAGLNDQLRKVNVYRDPKRLCPA